LPKTWIKPGESDHAYLAKRWAYINGTYCYVRAVTVDDNGDEIIDIHKDGRDYKLSGDTIYSVSV
jgi:hypothetical protein